MARDELRTVVDHLRRAAGAADVGEDTDRQLLERFARQRDERAFATLVRRHAGLVLGVCRRVLASTQDAEDVFQATFLILARKAATTRWRESIGNWLYEVAHRLARKARAEAARRQLHEGRAADLSSTETRPEESWRELCGVLDGELQRLPERYRQPLLLCYLEGQTRDRAARELGLSLRTLHRRLERGLKLLRGRLTARGATLPAALLMAALSRQSADAARSALLLRTTVRAAMGQPGISAAVAALVEGGMRSMNASKAKFVTALLLLTSGLAGAGALAYPRARFAPSPRAEPVKPKAVDERAEAAPPRVDRLGDPLPPGALFRLGSLRLRHSSAIGSIAFAQGGAVLIAADDNGATRFWDTANGKEIRHFTTGARAITCSPDGKTLATLAGTTVTLWDASTGKEIRKWRGRGGWSGGGLVPLRFAPDGQTLAALDGDKSATVWDVATGKELARLPSQEKAIVCLGFTADSKTLLTANGERQADILLIQWDARGGKELRKTRIAASKDKPPWLRPLAFSPDGKTIALEEAATARVKRGNVTSFFTEYRLHLADVASGKRKQRLDATDSVIWQAAFSPDNRAVACQRMDGSLSVWDAQTGKARFMQPTSPGNARPDGRVTLAFTPDGKNLAAAGSGNVLRLWDAATGRELLAGSEAHHDPIGSVVFAPDGKTVATGDWGQSIRLWDTTTGRPRLHLEGQAGAIFKLAYSREGKWLASSSQMGAIQVWDTATGKERFKFKEKRQSRSFLMDYHVRALRFSPDGQTLSSWGEDQMLRVWDLTTGKERSARHLVLPDVPEIPDPKPGEPHPNFPTDHVLAAAFLPDGRTILLATNKSIHLVDVASGRIAFTFVPHPAVDRGLGRNRLELSVDGQTVAIASVDKTVRLFELATGKEALCLTWPGAPGKPDWPNDVAFRKDGRTLAVAGNLPDSPLRIYSLATGEELSKWCGPNSPVSALAFRPDGKMLASGLLDTTAVLWEVPTAARPAAKKALPAETRKQLWDALAASDAVKAYRAMGTLTMNPEQALALLNQHLTPAPPIDPKRIQSLLAQLDHNEFAQREQASRELKKLGAAAEPALRELLKGRPSAEVARRAKAILTTPPPWTPPDPEALRRRRAIAILERIGSPAAGRGLAKLAQGDAAAPETRLAQDARDRLSLK